MPRSNSCLLVGICATLLLGIASTQAIQYDWKWRTGRASWYGDGLWPLHIGGCGYGYLWQDEGTGWDVAGVWIAGVAALMHHGKTRPGFKMDAFAIYTIPFG